VLPGSPLLACSKQTIASFRQLANIITDVLRTKEIPKFTLLEYNIGSSLIFWVELIDTYNLIWLAQLNKIIVSRSYIPRERQKRLDVRGSVEI
jgi:hypothetical protein